MQFSSYYPVLLHLLANSLFCLDPSLHSTTGIIEWTKLTLFQSMTPPARHSNLNISSASQQIVMLFYLRVDELVKVIEVIL